VPPEAHGAEYAQDAAIAILYALLSLAPQGDDDTDSPISAARHVTDALDRYIARLTGRQPDDPEYEKHVTNHELLRAERERQQRDLDDLLRLLNEANDWGRALSALRDRAIGERISCLTTAPLSPRLS
jgi:hypothetical protein